MWRCSILLKKGYLLVYLVYNSFYFYQDRAPPHFKTIVRDVLNVKFWNRWIGRGLPIAWPSRNSHLMMILFFWKHVKNIVYSQKIRNSSHLRETIIHAVSTVTREMLHNVWATPHTYRRMVSSKSLQQKVQQPVVYWSSLVIYKI